MISRRTSSVPKDVFPRLLYCDSRCSQTCRRRSEACRRRSQTCRRRSQTSRQRSQVLPGRPNVLSGAPRCSQTYHNHPHGTPVPVIRDPSYSEGRPECPPRVWYSPEIDASKFILHILTDTPGVFQWLKYILLMSTLLGMLSRTLPITLNGTLPACLTAHSEVSSQDTPKYTSESLLSTLPIALNGTLLVY